MSIYSLKAEDHQCVMIETSERQEFESPNLPPLAHSIYVEGDLERDPCHTFGFNVRLGNDGNRRGPSVRGVSAIGALREGQRVGARDCWCGKADGTVVPQRSSVLSFKNAC